MGIRVLLLGIAVWLLFLSGRRLLRRLKSRQAGSHPTTPIVNMVSCHYCGLHLPQGEALENNSRYYCCREHMQADNV